MFDGYVVKEGYYLNINVFNCEILMDVMEYFEKYL